jgi:hypothetical protein
MKTLFIMMLALACYVNLHARDTTGTKDRVMNRRYFELSFGQSKLFISDSRLLDLRNTQAVVVPTNAILFLATFRPEKRLRIPAFLNLPTGPKQFIVDGLLVSERASPTFGTGVQFKVFGTKFGEKSGLEMEAGPMASFLLDRGGNVRFAPIVAGRFRFIKNQDFTMYLGSSYSIGINAFALIYGTGYVF